MPSHSTTFPPDYPVEYIEGMVRFFGRDFMVTPDVLIPRLETESLVRRARQVLKDMEKINDGMVRKSNGETEFLDSETSSEGQKQKTVIVDIGCGSGIIGTSLADLADAVILLDISPAALSVAEQNFRTHFPTKKAQFIISDLLSHLPSLDSESEILFVANLPYIRDDDWENMSHDTIHEPRLALFGGEQNGFELYTRLFEELKNIGYPFHCLFEFGFDQRTIAETTLKKYPQWEYSFFMDYAGVERFGEVKKIL